MAIGPFDTIEIITLAISTIALLFVLKAYKEGINTPTSKKFWNYFLLIAIFIFSNRLFTNIEAIAFKELFNLIEHLSVLVAATIFVIVTKGTLKGDSYRG